MQVYLRAWREHRMLTQRELAAQSGVDQSTIVRIEHGAAPARFSTLRKLAQAFGIAPELLRREPRDTERAA